MVISAYFTGPINGRSVGTELVARRQNDTFALRLPREMRRELKRIAKKRKESEGAICREAVRLWLEQYRENNRLTEAAVEIARTQTKSA